MHKDFIQSRSKEIVSYERYRKILNSMTISFTKLGEEHCELCEEHTHHQCQGKRDSNEQEGENNNSEIYKRIEIHVERVRKLRESHCADANNNERNTEPCFSMDKLKFLMLPHLPGMKTAQITRRIVMINQSITPLGEFKNNSRHKPKGYLWHKGIQGRKDEDFASVVRKFLLESEHHDCKNITIWCDNCPGQNKNWTLYSSIVHSLSTSEVLVETFTLKYFEKRHTFMAADSFYHQLKEGILKRRYLYEFNDYIKVVNLCGNAMEMSHEDFYDFRNYKSNGKDTNDPLIDDISVVQFRKINTRIYWKTSLEKSEFKSGPFLQKKFCDICRKKRLPRKKGIPRGVNKGKKDDILLKLLNLMPENRRKFWETLPESLDSEDLSNNLEHLKNN